MSKRTPSPPGQASSSSTVPLPPAAEPRAPPTPTAAASGSSTGTDTHTHGSSSQSPFCPLQQPGVPRPHSHGPPSLHRLPVPSCSTLAAHTQPAGLLLSPPSLPLSPAASSSARSTLASGCSRPEGLTSLPPSTAPCTHVHTLSSSAAASAPRGLSGSSSNSGSSDLQPPLSSCQPLQPCSLPSGARVLQHARQQPGSSVHVRAFHAWYYQAKLDNQVRGRLPCCGVLAFIHIINEFRTCEKRISKLLLEHYRYLVI